MSHAVTAVTDVANSIIERIGTDWIAQSFPRPAAVAAYATFNLDRNGEPAYGQQT
jgi:hypothetical protein